MIYIVDHTKKFVHEMTYSEERCAIGETPVNTKELTDSTSYIYNLEKEKMYAKCPYCHEVPLIID